MNKITTVAAVLLIGTVVGAPAALAQTTTAPNSGAGLPGLPGNKSGPPVRPGDQFNIRLDQSNVPDCPAINLGRRYSRRQDCRIVRKVTKRKTRIRAASSITIPA